MHQVDMSDESVARKPRICLVDDDEIMLSLFSRIIKRTGCDVVTAQGPEAATTLLASTRVDMVISDLRMPDICDGEKLLGHLRECYPQLEIMMMSGDFSADTHARLTAAGATQCIQKPLTVDRVTGLIDALKNPELRREPKG